MVRVREGLKQENVLVSVSSCDNSEGRNAVRLDQPPEAGCEGVAGTLIFLLDEFEGGLRVANELFEDPLEKKKRMTMISLIPRRAGG